MMKYLVKSESPHDEKHLDETSDKYRALIDSYPQSHHYEERQIQGPVKDHQEIDGEFPNKYPACDDYR